jgi:hypothetical protein
MADERFVDTEDSSQYEMELVPAKVIIRHLAPGKPERLVGTLDAETLKLPREQMIDKELLHAGGASWAKARAMELLGLK